MVRAMFSDIIWGVVAVYTVGVAAWLTYQVMHRKGLDALAQKNKEELLEHHNRITKVEKGVATTQQELVLTRDAVVRLENRVGDATGPKLARRWPGES